MVNIKEPNEDKVCSECYQPLKKMKLGKSASLLILVCNNSNCLRYRQPQGIEGREPLSDAGKRYYL